MKFALLGDDAAAKPLIAAIAVHREHRVTHAALTRDATGDLLAVSPSTRIVANWDELIEARDVDAVIVAGADADVLEAARQIATAGKRLIVFPRALQGTTWVYELGLIRDDNGTALIPIFVSRFDRRLERIRALIDRSAIGSVFQIHIEREQRVTDPKGGVPLVAVDEVEESFLQDVDVFRFLGGNYSRVTSIHSGTLDDNLSQATSTLAGDGLPEALWSFKGTTGPARWQLSVSGDSGKLNVVGDPEKHDWRVSINGIEEPPESTRNPGDAMLSHVEQSLAGQAAAPDWTDVTRALEICDGARRSLRRRRTIDLHFESTSERSQFKTHMTAVGCSLLFLTLFAVVFVLIAGTLFDPREAAEVKAEHAGSILYDDSFELNSAELNEAGREQLNQIAAHMPGTTFPVIIEQVSADGGARLNDERRLNTVRQLQASGIPDADQRTIVYELRGRGFQLVMRIARFAVFVPLGLFLILQLLLFITRAPGR